MTPIPAEHAVCDNCKQSRPIWLFARWVSTRDPWCVECKRTDLPGWKRVLSKRYQYVRKYGLFPEDYAYLASLREGCWVCGRVQKLEVDHCHSSGAVRGLLCSRCNTGAVGDDIALIELRLAYLKADKPVIPDRRAEWEEWKESGRTEDFDHPLYRRWVDTRESLRHRGDAVPEQWITFEGFRDWALTAGWKEGLFLSRRKMSNGHSPDNSYWDVVAHGRGWRNPITAWGDTMFYGEWVNDPRCGLTIGQRSTFYGRLARGWTVERALSVTVEEGRESNAYKGTEVTIDDLTQSIFAWSRDPRCVVSYPTLTARIYAGWDPERALTTPTIDGMFTIGDTTLPAKDWVHHPLAKVGSYRTLARRLRQGWDFEEALTTGDGRKRPS